LDRTVGINTDYISTSDFRMQQIDREFCFEVHVYSNIKSYIGQTTPLYTL